jgi:hypothetical protein
MNSSTASHKERPRSVRLWLKRRVRAGRCAAPSRTCRRSLSWTPLALELAGQPKNACPRNVCERGSQSPDVASSAISNHSLAHDSQSIKSCTFMPDLPFSA